MISFRRSVAVGAVLLLLGSVGGIGVLGGSAAASSSSSTLPFTDPQADGYIGFCDLAGHNVTSGELDSVPFVWKAVSSARPPATYQGLGQNADLDIYQVRQDEPAGDWTGLGLIGDTEYQYKNQPTAAATYQDDSLRTISIQMPTLWDGLYALRMQFGKSGFGIYGDTYPMTVIQVTGARWHVVSGGLVNCARAHAESLETITGVASVLPKKPLKNLNESTAPSSDRATGSPSGASPRATSSPGVQTRGSSSGLTQSVADPVSAPLTLPHSHGGMSKLLLGVIVVVVLVVVLLGGLALGNRRGRALSQS